MPAPGHIARIRLSPKDCMSIADTLDRMGISTVNLSFNTAVKTVLSASLESLRKQGLIPERTGYEYSELMERWESGNSPSSRASKLLVTQLINSETVQIKPIQEEGYDRRKRRIRFEELMTKRNADPANFDEHEELAPLLEEFHTA